MKNKYLMIAAIAVCAGAFLGGCKSPSEKVENAQDKVVAANKDLDDATQAYLADVEKFRKDEAEKIAANDKSIAEFRARVQSQKNEARADYIKKVTDLEQKNSDMKKKISDYKAESKENWDLFKAEFRRDMDELGKSFQNLNIKNTK
jgi:hypothetical protein